MSNMYFHICLFILISIGCFANAQSAEIKKCQDEAGQWHYGNFADSSCVRSEITSLNSQGNVIGLEAPPPTKEALEEAARIQLENDEEVKRLETQHQKDLSIVQIYGSEELITSTRDRKLDAINHNVEITVLLRDGIVADLEELKTRKQNDNVRVLIKERELAIESYDQALVRSQTEIDKLNIDYDQILKSFRDVSARLSSKP